MPTRPLPTAHYRPLPPTTAHYRPHAAHAAHAAHSTRTRTRLALRHRHQPNVATTMPLQKPSPHRFLAPHPPSTQTPKAKPKSSLRHVVTPQTPKQTPELQFRQITPAKRFVVASETPRPHAAEEPGSRAATDYTPRSKAQRKWERVESIEEASQSSPSRGAGGDAFDVVQTIEHGAAFMEEGDEHRNDGSDDDDDDEILFESQHRSKRRRTSSPTTPLRQPPPPETPLPSAAPHRFRFPPPAPTPLSALHASTTATATTAPPPRPHFLLPARPTSPETPPAPLPELFSPSRKTQKYLPTGLAATVQRWIIEAAQTGFAAREHRGVAWEREEGVKLKLRVSSLGVHGDGRKKEVRCLPGTTTFLRGDAQPALDGVAERSTLLAEDEEGTGTDRREGRNTDRREARDTDRREGRETDQRKGRDTDQRDLRVLLAGQGGARGAAGVQVRVGSVVGLRAPTWHVCVGGIEWLVGVDWAVL
ncbi:uncharacterized protein EKO05_0010286 [Ascochyta rabiei]|uniref:Uncharacterized protein n=1 Tax=Didymella rabiei TaxID=5454 RepID=A0A163F1B9_DIDRA|nr:uncharacterized protein EKO05_0010286 [Ascochyta rabiei]KZM24076.1 hypothetical protein ST47_g4772 [Ascochyta rabiei]UPX20040.1 hypothetical protein EKO05_0010286 [Ascochyta rabiei]